MRSAEQGGYRLPFSGLEAYSVHATANSHKINRFTLHETAAYAIYHMQHVSDNQEHWQKISVYLEPTSFRIRELIYHLFPRWLLKDDFSIHEVYRESTLWVMINWFKGEISIPVINGYTQVCDNGRFIIYTTTATVDTVYCPKYKTRFPQEYYVQS
jgi:hypothetical protein